MDREPYLREMKRIADETDGLARRVGMTSNDDLSQLRERLRELDLEMRNLMATQHPLDDPAHSTGADAHARGEPFGK